MRGTWGAATGHMMRDSCHLGLRCWLWCEPLGWAHQQVPPAALLGQLEHIYGTFTDGVGWELRNSELL